MLNALTIDLEDWGQSVLDPRLPITDRVVENTKNLLAFLKQSKVRATFFALGKVCEAHPELLPAIVAAGHEIGSHGYGHERVTEMTPQEFARDLIRSISVIESQTGIRPIGYRAPQFSISRQTLWAGPILADHGFRYSSSIFPISGRRYGIPDWSPFIGQWPNCRLTEFPITTLKVSSRRLPVCGGGYTRLLPAWVQASALHRMNRQGHPGVLYLHPYELAPLEVRWFRERGFPMSRKTALAQSLWRSRVSGRMEHLIKRFPFGLMREVLGLSMADIPACPPQTPGKRDQPVPVGA